MKIPLHGKDSTPEIGRTHTGTCRYCNQSVGFLRKQHPQRRDLHASGYQEMIHLAAQAASTHTFNETALRATLQAIAQRSRATVEDIDRALEEGSGRTRSKR